MPNLNGKEPGDNFYPQYQEVTTEPVGAIALVKGQLYTKGGKSTTGNQLVAPGTGGFTDGIYQVTRKISTAGTEGENKVQCLGPGTRVALIAKVANLHAGLKVEYDVTNHNVDLIAPTAAKAALAFPHYIGRIFKIYSKSDIAVEKDVTAVGDYVIVELEK